MTLPPERIGDKGQRYEVRAYDYPKPGLNVIGWSNDRIGAEKMVEAIIQAPGCTAAHVVDREEEKA